VLDLACGAGFGLQHVARTYPAVRVTGVDGDPYSVGLAAAALKEAGLADRTTVWQDTLEALDRQAEFDAVLVNMSMHECRDIERVTENVHRALRRGGYFVISDFPFPEDGAGLRTVPGRIMAGIQFLEAQIDDQLLPTRAYVDLLRSHGFESVDTFEITPTHAVTHGRVPCVREATS
jgi:SAM-dependent methyltransferase